MEKTSQVAKIVLLLLFVIGLAIIEFLALTMVVDLSFDLGEAFANIESFAATIADVPDRLIGGWLINFTTIVLLVIILALHAGYELFAGLIKMVVSRARRRRQRQTHSESAKLSQTIAIISGFSVLSYLSLAIVLK